MVTGSPKGTYFEFGKNIQALLGSSAGFSVCVKASQGSLDNIKRMASAENAGIGIVQSDVIEVLKTNKVLQGQRDIKELRLIAPLYNEEIHILARKSIHSLNDLATKKVNVGSVGGGTWITATTLFQSLALSDNELPILTNFDHKTAVQKVLAGELDAMIYVAGKPVELFASLSQMYDQNLLDQLHFVPIRSEPSQALPYFQASIMQNDYPWLSGSVDTLAVKSLLVAYDFSRNDSAYAKARCDQLKQLGATLRQGIYDLQGDSQRWHQKWQQVDLMAPVSGWERDTCSWNAISLVTDLNTGIEQSFAEEVAQAVSAQMTVELKEASSSLESVLRMYSLENVSIGIVQADIATWLKSSSSDADREMANGLRVIAPIHDRQLHVLAHKDIAGLEDLDGKTVAVSDNGSAEFLTAKVLSDAMGIRPKFVEYNELQAFQKVKNGRIDAMIVLDDKSSAFFSILNQRFAKYPDDFSQIHFVPIERSALSPDLPYVASELSPIQYTWLIEPIPTIGVQSLLISRDFSGKNTDYDKRRCQQIHTIYREFIGSTESSKKVSGWPLDQCAYSDQAKAISEIQRSACDGFIEPAYKKNNPDSWLLSYNSCRLSR